MTFTRGARHARRKHDPPPRADPHAGLRRPPRRRELAAGPLREGGRSARRAAVRARRRLRQAPLPSLERRPRRARPSRDGRLVLPAPQQACPSRGRRCGCAFRRGKSRPTSSGRRPASSFRSSRAGRSSRDWGPIRCGRTSTRSPRGRFCASGRAARSATPCSTSACSRESGTSTGTRRCTSTGIHPLRPSGSLTEEEWESLWRTIRKLMRRGVVQAEIRTVAAAEPPPHPLSGRGPDDSFYVYQQEVCRRCGTPISEFPLSARRMFACPRCQPQRGAAALGPSGASRLAGVPAGPRRKRARARESGVRHRW